MAKKASKASKSKKLLNLWPGSFTWTHALIALSVMFNIAMVALLILVARNDPFEDLYVHKGEQVMCSESYRNKQPADSRPLLDYHCADGKAYDFYLKGYNDYRASLGLKPVER